jgi:hypothetical protein
MILGSEGIGSGVIVEQIEDFIPKKFEHRQIPKLPNAPP